MIPRSRHARAAICVFSGALLALSCTTWDVWPLTWIGFVPMLFVALDPDVRAPFAYGWLTGLVAMAGTFYWIQGLLQRFGHMPFVAAFPIFLLLIGYQAIVFGLIAWAVRRLRDHLPLPVVLLAPVAGTAIEMVTPQVFPWYFAICQAWVRPIIQIADLTGPLGVTFLLLLANGALVDTLAPFVQRSKDGVQRSNFSLRPSLAALLTIGAALVYGQVRIHQVEAMRAAAPKVKVGVVQANVGINEKFVPGLEQEQLALHQRLSAKLVDEGAQLVVWPESAYPFGLDRRRRADFADGDPRQVMRGFRAPLLFGALTFGPRAEMPYPYNSALMLDASGEVRGLFDKNFLLVFGEYIPFYEHVPWFRRLVPEASNLARGDGVTTFPLDVGAAHYKVGPMICYEDIIPSFGRRLAAERPNLLVNITNDAWFGTTSEPYEHLALAVYRAVEHRLDLVRAVNTGVSAFVDATGRVVDESASVDPVATPGAPPVTLLHEVAMLEPTGLYGRVGDLFGALNLVALVGLGAWARRRAGLPVATRTIAVVALALAALTFAGAALLAGPSELPLAARLLLHHKPDGAPGAEAFSVGVRLALVGLVASVAVGALLGRWARARSIAAPRVEAVAGAMLAFVVPALLLGRIEGETATLAFTALGSAAAVLLGLRLVRAKPLRHKASETAPAKRRSR